MTVLAWDWLRRNVDLAFTLSAAICLVVALGKLVRGATWSLLLPVALSGVLCGWGLGSSRLKPKQAWVRLIAFGIPGVFLYVAGLLPSLGWSLWATFALVPKVILWLSEHTPVDFGPWQDAWGEVFMHAGNVLLRAWIWSAALVKGEGVIDLAAVALVWNLLLWLVCVWAGWQLRRNRQALSALTPGGVLLALVVDYTRGEVSLVIVYLAIMLALIGMTRNQWMQMRWQQRKVDYADSVVFETLLMVGMVTTGLVLSAAGTPSISWRELLDKLRARDRTEGSQVAESLGLQAPRSNIAADPVYWSDGLPRQHLLDTPPDQLKKVVFVVSTGEFPPDPPGAFEAEPERYHWRTITYDIYTGSGWRSSAAQENELPSGTSLMDPPEHYRILTQHIVRAPGENAYVFWTGLLARSDKDVQIAWRTFPPERPDPVSNGDMLGALTTPDEYTVVSYVPQINLEQLRIAGSDYPPAIARRYLRLPDTVPGRVLDLARRVTQSALTPYDRAVAIESYLRSFPYTLDVAPPPSDRDVVDYFLFTAQQGYCDYYASAMVVLARAVGLPARMVIGYTSGEFDAERAEYIVRQENAHSWAEVYFAGYGWVEFEPTASQPALQGLDEKSASNPPPGLPPMQQALSWLQDRWRGLVTSLGGQLLLALTGLILIFAMGQAGEIGLLHLMPSHRAIPRIYSRLEKASSSLLPNLPRGHTPGQLGTGLTEVLNDARDRLRVRLFSGAQGEIEMIVNLYMAESFSLHPPERSQVRQAILSWIRLRWRLWAASRWIKPK